jgi:hypothetical protein
VIHLDSSFLIDLLRETVSGGRVAARGLPEADAATPDQQIRSSAAGMGIDGLVSLPADRVSP